MVPLRSEFGEGKTSSWNETSHRPHLVLCDVTVPSTPHPPRPKFRGRNIRRWDSVALSAAVVSVLAFFAVSFVGFLWHTAASSYQSSFAPAAPIIQKRVAPGDTLWRYAAQYGDPNSYILERVETIARDNNLSSSAPLVPGQVLRIAVQNPVVIAQIAHRHSSRLAALPRE